MEIPPHDVLTLVLAGGKGSRLEPLTLERAKPAVPFGGAYRIIDLTLSNCINSGLRRILVLSQYKAASLERHLMLGWQFLYRELDEFIDVLPPQQRIDESWYLGTADAVYQNIYTIEKHQPKYVLILSGDHIYRMDYGHLLAEHIASGSPTTLACIPVDRQLCRHFGVVHIDARMRVTGFDEKPETTAGLADDPGRFLASMGIYVFDAGFLFELLCQDAAQAESSHDFGKDIMPSIIQRRAVMAFPFRDPQTGQLAYWRDVGTLDAYYEASMDLLQPQPPLDPYDPKWLIQTYHPPLPPAKILDAAPGGLGTTAGQVRNSIVGAGAVIVGGSAERSIVSRNVRIEHSAEVRDSVLFEGVCIGRGAKIRRAVLDKEVQVREGAHIGYELKRDEARGATVSDAGIVVVPKGRLIDP